MIPLVSIILPTYNRARTIGRAIESLLAQTEGQFEVIVVDDGSTDETQTIIESLNDGRIRHLRQSANRGAAASRNVGIRAAAAPLIAFQDSDDEWDPDKLRKQLEVMASCPPEVGVVYSDMWRVRRDGSAAYHVSPTVVPGRHLNPEGEFYQTYCLGIQTTLVRRHVLEMIGGLDESLRFYDDMEMYLRAAQVCAFRRIAEPLVRYYDTGGLVNNWRQELADRRVILGRHSQAVYRESRRFWITERAFLAARGLLGPVAHSFTQRQRNLLPAQPVTLTDPPQVSQVSDEASRPFWSVMIPAYCPDRAQFTLALSSVLQQDPGRDQMQICVVDDGSPGRDVERWVEALAPGRVEVHRRPRNGGLAQAWNSCLELARGRWVHLLHQDDLVLPGFYARLQTAAEQHPELGAACVQHHVVDQEGRLGALISRNPAATPGIVSNWLEMVFVQLSFQTPAVVVRREVYERLGGFRTDFKYALDWDMWRRVAASYPLWYEPTPLAGYRRHRGSTSTGFLRSGDNITELRRSIDVSRQYLPAELGDRMVPLALKNLREVIVDDALNGLFTHRDWQLGWAQMRGARQLGAPADFPLIVMRRLVAAVTRRLSGRGRWSK